MESVVATLPLAPRNTNSIGYFLQPFTAWLLGQYSDNRNVVAINTLGLHLTWPEYGAKEYCSFIKLFSGRKLLISRFRATGLTVRVNHRDYNIDPDFACDRNAFSITR